MPYKDLEIRKQKAKERKIRWQDRERQKRVDAGLPADGRGKHNNHASKDSHPRWNNGIATSSHGYLKIQVGKKHPLADPNGYAYLHHLVWISAGNNPLSEGELIHHEDENTKNNRIDNLEIISGVAAHFKLHKEIKNSISL